MSQRTQFSLKHCTYSELKQCMLSMFHSVTDLTGEVHMTRRVNKVDKVVFSICMEENNYVLTGCLYAMARVWCHSLAC